jgi:RNA recognition motif-containing protein
MSARLFVGNLNFSLSDEELREAFLEIGPVERAEVVRDRFDGRSRGFGFVEMANDADGERAVEGLNGRELMGRPMRVEMATSRRNAPAPRAAA